MSQPLSSIALVGPLPPPSGGMANQTRQLARLLGEAGVDVRIVRVNTPYRPGWIERVRGVRAVFRLIPYLVALWRAAGRVQVMHVFANSGWSWHLFAAPAVWIAYLRGTPVLINYRGGEAGEFFRHSFRWVLPTVRRASAVVVPSRFLEQVFAQWSIDTVIVPNIVDLSRFGPGAGAASGRPHVIVTRNLEPIYDIETALRVFHRLRRRYPGARLTVAGTGPELERLRALAEDLGIAEAVHFAGRMDNDDIPELYRSANLMLNTSRVDNMPISILEALASGVPVVSSDAGGIPHLVDHEVHVLLAPPGDVDALTEHATRLLDDGPLRQRLVEAGIRRAAEYGWDRVRGQWFAVYDAVRSRTASPGREARDGK